MDRESDQRRAARPLVAGLAVLAVVATAAGGPAAALGTSRSSAGRHGQRPPGVAGAAARSSLGLLTPGSEQNAVTTNWSGYVLTAGQYTAINGAFTVPQVTRYVAGSTVSEWVGVDGYGNSSLVQAGVDEIPEGPGKEMVVPWWEVLPSPQVTATGVMVRVGDTVTVT
ncbi:MAG TPA: G1 family glutamic endopeptidase, partial [Acidimicrobiales bacterium]|nr:G1 family glutamic endopeptidase [Acidimicrobiales bacterium]